MTSVARLLDSESRYQRSCKRRVFAAEETVTCSSLSWGRFEPKKNTESGTDEGTIHRRDGNTVTRRISEENDEERPELHEVSAH